MIFLINKNNSNSFKFKQQITRKTRSGGAKDVEVMVPLKYLRNFWKTLEMPLIYGEISLQLKWSRKCIIEAGTANNQNPIFQVNDTKICVPVVIVGERGHNPSFLDQLLLF